MPVVGCAVAHCVAPTVRCGRRSGTLPLQRRASAQCGAFAVNERSSRLGLPLIRSAHSVRSALAIDIPRTGLQLIFLPHVADGEQLAASIGRACRRRRLPHTGAARRQIHAHAVRGIGFRDHFPLSRGASCQREAHAISVARRRVSLPLAGPASGQCTADAVRRRCRRLALPLRVGARGEHLALAVGSDGRRRCLPLGGSAWRDGGTRAIRGRALRDCLEFHAPAQTQFAALAVPGRAARTQLPLRGEVATATAWRSRRR